MKNKILDILLAAELLALSAAGSYGFFTVVERGAAFASGH